MEHSRLLPYWLRQIYEIAWLGEWHFLHHSYSKPDSYLHYAEQVIGKDSGQNNFEISFQANKRTLWCSCGELHPANTLLVFLGALPSGDPLKIHQIRRRAYSMACV